MSSDSDRQESPEPPEPPARRPAKTKTTTVEDEKVPELDAKQKRLNEIRKELENIKKQFEDESVTITKTQSVSELRNRGEEQLNIQSQSMSVVESTDTEEPSRESYQIRLAAKKGRQRERETLDMLQNFKKKLRETKVKTSNNESRSKAIGSVEQAHDELEVEELDKVDGDDWLQHRFEPKEEEEVVLAKDANTKDDDWYPVDDPRNSMVKRIETDRSRYYRERKHDHDRDRVHHRERSGRSREKRNFISSRYT